MFFPQRNSINGDRAIQKAVIGRPVQCQGGAADNAYARIAGSHAAGIRTQAVATVVPVRPPKPLSVIFPPPDSAVMFLIVALVPLSKITPFCV